MKILFIRHAQAEELGHGKPGLDETRRIVKKGEAETRLLADALDRLGVRPKLLFTSPFVRAHQTADVLADRIRRCPDPKDTRSLVPGASWADLKREIARHGAELAGKKGDVVLFAVGHQPGLSEMICDALGAKGKDFALGKSACVGLSWKDDKPYGTPEIFLALTVEQARTIAKL